MIIVFTYRGNIVRSYTYKQESREEIARLLRKKLIPKPKLYDNFTLM